MDANVSDYLVPDEAPIHHGIDFLKIPLTGLTLVGWYLWSIIWRRTRSNLKKPINQLILVELVIQGFGLVNNFFLLLVISTEEPLSSYVDPILGHGNFCHGLIFLLAFRLCYSWTGSPAVGKIRY